MEEKRYDVESVKTRLRDYREKERDIDNQIERIEHIEAKMTGVGAQILTDMPHAPSITTDRISDLLSQKMEIEDEVRKDIESHNAEKRKIEEIIKHLRISDERAVIRMRYLDGASWNEVRDMMFGWKKDYEGKEDSYLRRIHKIHGSALLNMAIYMEDQNTAFPAAL